MLFSVLGKKEMTLNRETNILLNRAVSDLKNVALLIDEMTLTRMLVSASAHDIKEAVKNALMIGDRDRVLRALKEAIEEVESV